MGLGFDIATEYTLPEILRTKAPDGSHMSAIDTLSGKYPLIEEGYWLPANDDTSHEYLRTTQEPTGNLVRLNEGAAFEAAGTTPVREFLARMESNLRIDVRALQKAADPVKFRKEREAAHVRGMIKQFAKIIFSVRDASAGPFFGDMDIDPKSINGLGKRYGKISGGLGNVLSCAGASADVQSSIWLIKWGPDGVFFVHPKTVSNTIQVNDLREQVVYDSSGRPYRAVLTNFAFEFGMGVADHRAVQRYANIATAAGATTGSFDNDTDKEKGEKALIDLIENLPSGDTTNCAFYAGPKVMAAMRKRLNSKANLYFNMQDVWGRKQLTFMDVPFLRLDALNAVEAIVS
jgi:hypothetical protein